MKTSGNNILSRKSNRKLLMAVGAVSFFSLVCTYLTEWPDNVIQHLDGTLASGSDIKSSNCRMILLNVPLLGIALGSLLSLIPFRQLSYKEKWSRFTIVTMMILATLTFISIGVSFIRYQLEI